MKKIWLFTPLALLLLVVFFLVSLLRNPNLLSASENWQGKPFPEFNLPHLLEHQTQLNKASLPKEPFILNVWASWCGWCIKEFPIFIDMKNKGIPIVGLTYANRPEDAKTALKRWGNPFVMVIDDFQQSFLSQTLNINAAPTTYLIDKQGIIRYQQKGYNPNFEADFMPRLLELRQED
ncbi:cytochrome c biogenesis protein CcmG/thiol:disulfide interchange protein DsbE [Bisgaardia hudsonensis]|uniref:Cytochrome c biogenesis protein CcmG/thiol:disulfide interchange protein DsbE n=1 Tax=Bisgaardia hudsonensis TaxID=109472 RepID=A0A4R2N0G5_9PAST|nr:redoxin family protein [Bisgaardia hudsonensis]QLB13477.1 dihydroneopterin aldolase [Bisgaardia hudsonensis]TCP12886.1 cytochrome c biogenesis protein CcmG/thiol:disulfide interchange protein DsbE [Bisgaardia hudsonensis]